MTDMLPILLALALAFSILLIFVGLASPRPVDPVRTRLEQYAQREAISLEELELAQPFSERVLAPLLKGLAGFVSRFTPMRTLEGTAHKLDLAGNPNNWTAADFLGVRGLTALVSAGLPFGLLLVIGAELPNVLLFTVLLGGLGFYLPVIWLSMRIRARQTSILRSLPDALDLLTISVEAGLGFDAAMQKVTERMSNELGRAFARVLAETRVGRARRDALREMSNRAEVRELTSFIAAIIQAEQLGVSIARVLRIQSEQMRIRRRQRAEELAQQAAVKMLFPMVFLIFPSLLVVLLGPAIPQIRDLFFTGQVF